MKKHSMRLNNEPFEKIKSGEKTIEMRLYDKKRQKIDINDEITFINRKTEEEITCWVEDIFLFKNFEDLYKNVDKKELGYAENEEANFLDMEKHYSKEEQSAFGVVAIKVKVI